MSRPLFAVLALAAASVAEAQTWRTVDVSRQVHDTAEHRIRVNYGAGRFFMRPTADPVLYSMQLRYDEERSRPVHRYDADWRSATLGLDMESVRWTKNVRDDDLGEMHLALSNAVPLDLELRLGATRATIDAGGLTLTRLQVETGAARADLDFSAPNRGRMRRLDIKLGAAGLALRNLANANVTSIRVEGGVGSVDLDFGGEMKEDVSVEAQVALGSLRLRVPRDAGVRVELERFLASFDRAGLRRRGDAYYSDNWDTAEKRIRIRAETVLGSIDLERVP